MARRNSDHCALYSQKGDRKAKNQTGAEKQIPRTRLFQMGKRTKETS